MLRSAVRSFCQRARPLRVSAWEFVSHASSTAFDWLFLALLGVIISLLSVAIEALVNLLYGVRHIVVFDVDVPPGMSSPAVRFILYVLSTVVPLAAASAVCHIISPQAIGSGIPEMKTIIRGVMLKDYLAPRTLVAKTVGLVLSLGSAVPIGKMGSLVHISSIVTEQMSRLAARIEPSWLTDNRRLENLSAAAAIAVACTFSAPVGGVLFSMEVTTAYFCVRSFWRGFFASCCAAITFRLFTYAFGSTSEMVNRAYYQTTFGTHSYVVEEMPVFAAISMVCGVLGALYNLFYKKVVLFLRNNATAKWFFQRHWIIYPLFYGIIYAGLSFPFGMGRFFVGRLRLGWNLRDFFDDCSFKVAAIECDHGIFERWTARDGSVLMLITCFAIALFIFSATAQTLPMPSGIFLSIFVLGAAIGRLHGEILLQLVEGGGFRTNTTIHPGVYAVVGAASFSAAVAHSVSVSVMIFEATGQIVLILPVMMGVILAKGVSSVLHTSFFDTVIRLKQLPYLPDISPSNKVAQNCLVADFMTSRVFFLTRQTTLSWLAAALQQPLNIRFFPVVDNSQNQILVGIISRKRIIEILKKEMGPDARRREAERLLRERQENEEGSDDEGGSLSDDKTIDIAMRHLSPADADACENRNTSRISWRTFVLHSQEEDKKKKGFFKRIRGALPLRAGKQKISVAHLRPDLSRTEHREWERQQLMHFYCIADDSIEETPFQMSPRTTLLRAHANFSMLHLNLAFVTECGRLVGVVSLSDIRRRLEMSGRQTADESPMPFVARPSVLDMPSLIHSAIAISASLGDVLTPVLEVVPKDSHH